jgi:hypothetical protein
MLGKGGSAKAQAMLLPTAEGRNTLQEQHYHPG